MSENQNSIEGAGQIGAILGFAAFGVAFLTTVVMIFIDIQKRKKEYEEMIQDDKQQMQHLGMASMLPEIEAELKKRLTGIKVEDVGDDQLMGEAAKLAPGDFASQRR